MKSGTAKREIISSSITESVSQDPPGACLKNHAVCISITPRTTNPRNNNIICTTITLYIKIFRISGSTYYMKQPVR